jgi:hypothetical protein
VNPELVSFVFRPLTRSGAAARSRLGSVIALPPQLRAVSITISTSFAILSRVRSPEFEI